MKDKTQRLLEAMVAAGYPVLAVGSDTTNGPLKVTLLDSATAAQRMMADAFVSGYIDIPKKIKTKAQLLTELTALRAADQNKVLLAIAARVLQDNPDLITDIISGDQPE